METLTRLSRHNKFISAENITILSVSSDDYLHASLSLQSSKYIYIYIYIYEGSRKNLIQIGEFIMVQSRRFGFSNHHQDLDIKIVHIAMDSC